MNQTNLKCSHAQYTISHYGPAIASLNPGLFISLDVIEERTETACRLHNPAPLASQSTTKSKTKRNS